MSRRIMAVDDSQTMRDMVSFTLKTAGYDVQEASDGKEALATLKGRSVDLVITDINMPNMDGIALVKALRADPAFKSTPILILTTESDTARKEEGRAAGATGWIVKPFDAAKLVGALKRVLPASAMAANP